MVRCSIRDTSSSIHQPTWPAKTWQSVDRDRTSDVALSSTIIKASHLCIKLCINYIDIIEDVIA